jgi:pyruvate formate lyase activating enzyme
VSNSIIISNFRVILSSGTDIFVRIPVVPGFNDDDDHMERLRNFLIENNAENLKKVNLLPFHKIGSAKYKKFNVPYVTEHIKPPSRQRMDELKKYFSETGIQVTIGG